MTLRIRGTARAGAFELYADLEVRAGELTVVIGPNGAGKSTLLRAVAGLTAYAGVLSADDRDLAAMPTERRRAGFVFADHRLFPHLDVRHNVAFGPRSQGASRRDAVRQATTWLNRLDLTDLAQRRPAQLSTGQSQRVALARALASDPAVLLLDEPMAALDASARVVVRRELRSHLANFAGPVLLVTHDPLEALVMADRIVVVDGGRITQVGTPAEVASRPATPYVARFVGLNLLAGRGIDDGIDLDGWTLHCAHQHPGEPLLAALRPSAITVHRHRPEGSSRNVWTGEVGDIDLVGDRVRLQVHASHGPDALVDLTAAALTEMHLGSGDEVWLSAKATDIETYPG